MARAWHLKSRPNGMPTDENFELKEIQLPAVGEGTIRVHGGVITSSTPCPTLRKRDSRGSR